jgi:probable HAF family extracellular repeat protein
MTRTLPFVLLSLVTVVFFAANPCTAQSYTLTVVPISPTAINNNGQIGGQGSNGDPAILSSNGTLTDLGNFGSSCDAYGCRAYAINSLGDAVGLTGTSGGGYNPFLFSKGTLTELPTNGGTPQGINTADTVVGFFTPNPGESIDITNGFVIKNGVFTDLGTPDLPSEAHGINTSGQIAGDTVNPSTNLLTATVWQPDGTISFLGVLGTGFESRAFAINDAGQVTGSSYTAQGSEHAFLFSNGQMTDIDTLGSLVSRGYAINNNGVVVGAAAAPNQPGIEFHAVVVMGGSMMDLNTLIAAGSGLTLYQANGINDAGEIVGFAQSNTDGSVSGFLLTPVAPQITAISPATGKVGTVVTIAGKNFSKKPAACKVTFNGKVAKWTKWTNNQVEVVVPAGATTGKVVLTAFFQKSNGKTFTVTK